MIATPACCATLLKPAAWGEHHDQSFFGWFNACFNRNAARYEAGVGETAPQRALDGGLCPAARRHGLPVFPAAANLVPCPWKIAACFHLHYGLPSGSTSSRP